MVSVVCIITKLKYMKLVPICSALFYYQIFTCKNGVLFNIFNTNKQKGKIMKKFMSVLGLCGVAMLAACDSNATAKIGDTVVIDFAGYLDGVQFDGGTATGFPLKLGSGQFVPGFEDQVVGMKVGETRDINITFPEQYVEGLAGKAVVFKVTVQEIQK